MGNVDGKELWLPIANLVSICALLIWYPANPNDTITRLLFPGSTPQHKIFKGLEKLKRLECLKQPVCSPNSIQNTKSSSKSEKRKRFLKSDNKNILPDNSMIEKKEKMAKKRIEKLRKEKKELEKAEKEKKEKERLEKLEKRKKADREKKEKEKLPSLLPRRRKKKRKLLQRRRRKKKKQQLKKKRMKRMQQLERRERHSERKRRKRRLTERRRERPRFKKI